MLRIHPAHTVGLSLLMASALACQTVPPSQPPPIPEVVVVPTLGMDHQFDLDYSVAHIAALLDAIAPDAIAIADVTEWLQSGCLYRAVLPENQVALSYAREKSVAIWGTRAPGPASEFDQTAEAAVSENARYETPGTVEREYTARLDDDTARINTEFTSVSEPQTLRFLLQSGFAQRTSTWTAARRVAGLAASRKVVDALVTLVVAHPQQRRWVVFVPWRDSFDMGALLRAQPGISYRPLEAFLSAADRALASRMDAGHIAWILSGMLDEWYGMWKPGVFPTQRIAALLHQLQVLAPHDPSTRFIEARWLMRNRQFKAAEPLLLDLVSHAGQAQFPFPVNGKWMRPPWRSVQMKATLNLAFLRDLQGDRAGALRLYQELLLSPDLDVDARAAGYFYDDIRWVIESYTRLPFTDRPEEAFRHYRVTAAIPPCAPKR